MNSPFNLVHIKRDIDWNYEALRNISVLLKLFNDQTNNRCDQKNNIGISLSNKLKPGESSKYATLTMKATIFDKGDIILPSWIEMK
jgi:hypothetical protein